MARLFGDDIQTINKGVKVIAGSFRPNGSSAIDNDNNTGQGFSVARTGAGEFTITLDQPYNFLISGLATLQLATADDRIIQLRSFDVTNSSKTVVFEVTDAQASPTASDIASDAGNRVHFFLWLTDTKLKVN